MGGTCVGAMRPNTKTDPLVNAAGVGLPLEEATLVERCRRGDSAAFGQLVVSCQDRVFNTCWRMCGNRADAEDLTQEAFVKAFQSIGRFDGRSRFYTWVFRIAVNLAISARRKDRRAVVSSLDEVRDASGQERSASPVQRLASRDGSPELLACGREQAAIVMQALEGLDGEHRAVVILRDLESLGYDEIAEILDIPPGTVKSRLHRARVALREALSPILETRVLRWQTGRNRTNS